jgi:hypothetical protein
MDIIPLMLNVTAVDGKHNYNEALLLAAEFGSLKFYWKMIGLIQHQIMTMRLVVLLEMVSYRSLKPFLTTDGLILLKVMTMGFDGLRLTVIYRSWKVF